MKYIKGDIIALAKTGQWDAIIHGCNCFCTMGSGVAVSIRNEWPEAYAADCQTVKGDWSKLGDFSFVEVPMESNLDGTILLVNAYTQYSFGSGKHLEYKAVDDVFKKLTVFLAHDHRLLIPKIGAGLAGGDWSLIEKIIDAYGLNVTCCVLE